VACVDGGEDGEERGVGGEVLGGWWESGTGADCESLVGRFGGEEGEERCRWVYWVFVDVLWGVLA
jgi:hypothetical protein